MHTLEKERSSQQLLALVSDEGSAAVDLGEAQKPAEVGGREVAVNDSLMDRALVKTDQYCHFWKPLSRKSIERIAFDRAYHSLITATPDTIKCSPAPDRRACVATLKRLQQEHSDSLTITHDNDRHSHPLSSCRSRVFDHRGYFYILPASTLQSGNQSRAVINTFSC